MRVSNEKVSEIFILNDENKYIFKIPGLDVPARNRSKERSASMSINYGTFNFQPLNSIEGNTRSCTSDGAAVTRRASTEVFGRPACDAHPRSSASFNHLNSQPLQNSFSASLTPPQLILVF